MNECNEQAGPAELDEPLSGERVAHDEATARHINESIVEDGRVSRDGLTGFVCECGRLGCNAIVPLTRDEYAQVRTDPRRFFVMDGHEVGFEIVVERGAWYAVVEKRGLAGRVAEATDPRAGDG